MYMTAFNCIQCAYTVNSLVLYGICMCIVIVVLVYTLYKVYLWYEQYLNNCMHYLWYSIFSNAASTGLLQVTTHNSWLGSYRYFRLSDS